MKSKLILFSVLFGLLLSASTTNAQDEDPLDMGFELYYKCLKDTIFVDQNNQIRSNEKRLDELLVHMKPDLFFIYDSTGYMWYVDIQFRDLQIPKDSFEKKVIIWIDSTNSFYQTQGMGDTCIHFYLYRMGRLSTKGIEHYTNGFQIAPNPGEGSYVLKSKSIDVRDGTLNICNALGQTLAQHRITGSLQDIQLEAPSGIYYFHFVHNNGMRETHKIIHSP